MSPMERLLVCLGWGVVLLSTAFLLVVLAGLACKAIARSLRIARRDLAALKRTRADLALIREALALWRVVHGEYPHGPHDAA